MGEATDSQGEEEQTVNAPLIPEDQEPFRIKKVAECLGISDKTVRRRIDEGKIPSVKMGGLRVIWRCDFEAYWRQLKGMGGQNV